MDESTMLKIAMVVGMLGICSLLIVLKASKIGESTLGEAKLMEEGGSAKITGTIERVSAKDQFTILTLRSEERVSVVAFSSMNLSKGQRIEVTGKIKEYEGENEIVADNVIVLAR